MYSNIRSTFYQAKQIGRLVRVSVTKSPGTQQALNVTKSPGTQQALNVTNFLPNTTLTTIHQFEGYGGRFHPSAQ